MKSTALKNVVLERNATAFLTEHEINFDLGREFEVIPNKGKVYRKKLDDMTVRELLLSSSIYGNGLALLITLSPRKGQSKVVRIFAELLRHLID
jgi:hypothetical protein